MSDIEVDYEDKKDPQITISCRSLFADLEKKSEDVLEINLLQVYVEVPLEGPPANSKKVVTAIKKVAESAGSAVCKDMEDLVTNLRKLQKEEQQGSKKAATEARNLVKKTEKEIKKWAGELGGSMRKAVQDEVGSRENLRSVSRTIFRGMELNGKAFKGSPEKAEAPAGVADLAKALAATGKEVFDLTTQEKELRKSLGTQIEKVQQLVEKVRTGKKDFDIGEFYKENSKESRALESSVDEYVEFVKGLRKNLDDAEGNLNKLNKLLDKNKDLEDIKEVKSQCTEYGKAIEKVAGTLEDKSKAGERAKGLFKEDYKAGEGWRGLVTELAALKGAAKSGKVMQDIGAALEKKLKG